MSEKITGVITKVRKDRKGFYVNSDWYSLFNKPLDGINKGDTVTFEFTNKDGKWNNVVDDIVTVTAPATSGSGGGGKGGGNGTGFRTVPELNRIDGLRFAVEIIGSTVGSVKERVPVTLKVANLYVQFIEGNLEQVIPAGGAAAASTPDAEAKAAAEAAAEAAALAAEEEARKASEAAAAAQQAAGQSVLDDFLGG